MEINRFDEVMGVQATAAIVEGLMVLLIANDNLSYDFGSNVDLPGVKVPATAEEAKRARWILTFPVDNRQPPYYTPTPALTFALRKGFDQAANAPFSATVAVTYPGYKNCATIADGSLALAFSQGTFTVPSGCGYISDAAIAVPGCLLQVANTAEDTTDAGKLKVLASMSDRFVGIVEAYDSSNGDLTFRIVR